MLSVSGSTCRCEQLLSLLNNVKSRARSRLSEKYMTIAVAEIKLDTERLLKREQCTVSQKQLILVKKTTG